MISFHPGKLNPNTTVATNFVRYGMNIHLARSLVAALHGDQCIFGYSGRFPDEHSARLIELGEAVHSGGETTLSSKGRLGYVMVEAYQNIVRHRAFPKSEAAWGKRRNMFLLRCLAHGHLLVTRNPVSLPQEQKLEKRLLELRSKSMNELKELFMEAIQRPNVPGTRGAGLGLIEMVRRAGVKPAWSFDPLDQDHVLFNLALGLGDPGSPVVAHLGDAEEFPPLLVEHGVSCFYVGFWNPGVQKALLGFVREEKPPTSSNVDEHFSAVGRMADMLYSMIHPEGPMIFSLQEGAHPTLSVGGQMEQADLDHLKSQVLDTDVRISTGAGERDGTVLVMVHMPW